MALRDLSDSCEMATSSLTTALARLLAYWDSPESAANIEWEEWWKLFMVAVHSKYSISVEDLLRNMTEN